MQSVLRLLEVERRVLGCLRGHKIVNRSQILLAAVVVRRRTRLVVIDLEAPCNFLGSFGSGRGR